MSVSIPEFWQLATESRLLTPEQCQQLAKEFGQLKGASSQGSAGVLVEWLISKSVLTRYQTTILAGGHSGPFFYSDYKVYDRVDSPPLADMFRAVHSPTSHPVLLQFLTGPVTQDARQWSIIHNRLKMECGIKHPHLHRCFEVVDLTSFKFVVIEDLRGQSADQMIAGGKRLPPQEACRIVRSAAMALGQMHRSNLVHGDVRPPNFWMENGGNVKLIRDPAFGPLPVNLARADQQLVIRGDYLAPEFTQPGKAPDAVTDIYALGCAFYELLAGRVPFPGGDLTQKMQQHASQPIQPLENMGVPQPIAQMVAYMMAKNPAVRYQNADQIAEQLGQFVDPNRLNVPQPAPKATLPAYEQAIAARQAAAPAAAPLQPAGVAQPAGSAVPVINPAASGAAGPAIVAASATTGDGGVQKRYAKTKEEKDKEKIKKVGIGLAVAGGLLIALLILINAMRETGEPIADSGTGEENPIVDTGDPAIEPELIDDDGTPNVGTTPGANGEETDTGRYIEVADDGNLLWSSPTSGESVDLHYLPAGSRFYMVVRPSAMLATVDGAKVVNSLGPSFQQQRAAWETATGFDLSEVERLTLSLHQNSSGGFPEAAMVVRLMAKIDRSALLGKWGNPPEQEIGGEPLYKGRDGWFFYVPVADDGKTFVMGTAAQLSEVIENKGAEPLIGRAMSRLVETADADRHFTILFTPNELISNMFRDGVPLSIGPPRKIREPIDWFLGDGIEAGSASIHFADNTLVEMRMIGRGGQITKDALATEMRDRLEQIPDRVEQYVISLDPHPYWKTIAFRFPQMVRYLYRQARVGAEGDIAVLNAILPSGAAQNIVFASELALASTPGAPPTAVATNAPAGPKTIGEALDVKMSIAFGQDSLEFSMQNIESELKDMHPNLPFPFAIKIIGGDLEKNGITRNQQIRDFAENGKTVAEILTAMVLKANPIKTVKQPNEIDQQLIWVVGPDPDDATREVILITTRDAAKAKNYALPKVFQPAP